jgi:hypothetical protein
MRPSFSSVITKHELKGPFHEIIDLRFFSSNNSIWASDPRFKAFLHMASYSRRYSTRKSTFWWSAVSMTSGQRCHWHCWPQKNRFQSRISPRIRSHMQKGFNPWAKGPKGVVWWKNQRSKISWQGPFNHTSVDFFCVTYITRTNGYYVAFL